MTSRSSSSVILKATHNCSTVEIAPLAVFTGKSRVNRTMVNIGLASSFNRAQEKIKPSSNFAGHCHFSHGQSYRPSLLGVGGDGECLPPHLPCQPKLARRSLPSLTSEITYFSIAANERYAHASFSMNQQFSGINKKWMLVPNLRQAYLRQHLGMGQISRERCHLEKAAQPRNRA